MLSGVYLVNEESGTGSFLNAAQVFKRAFKALF